MRLTDKGFGFIKREEGQSDIFFHAKDLADGLRYEDLRENDTLTFDIGQGPKGDFAQNIKRVAEAQAA